MNDRFFSIALLTMISGGLCLVTSCSTGVFFADDNQEGHVGFVSATQYRDVSDVLIVKKGAAPRLAEEVTAESPSIPVAEVVKTDTLLKSETKMSVAAAMYRYDIPIIEVKKEPVTHSTFVSTPR